MDLSPKPFNLFFTLMGVSDQFEIQYPSEEPQACVCSCYGRHGHGHAHCRPRPGGPRRPSKVTAAEQDPAAQTPIEQDAVRQTPAEQSPAQQQVSDNSGDATNNGNGESSSRHAENTEGRQTLNDWWRKNFGKTGTQW